MVSSFPWVVHSHKDECVHYVQDQGAELYVCMCGSVERAGKQRQTAGQQQRNLLNPTARTGSLHAYTHTDTHTQTHTHRCFIKLVDSPVPVNIPFNLVCVCVCGNACGHACESVCVCASSMQWHMHSIILSYLHTYYYTDIVGRDENPPSTQTHTHTHKQTHWNQYTV